MYVARAKWKSQNNQIYESVWLRESFRENGRVKTRNIANLKDCSPQQIAALELALKHKDDLDALVSLDQLELRQGKSFGAVYVLHHLARKLGLEKALGADRAGKLALWQVFGRVLDQGSCLSALRRHLQALAVVHDSDPAAARAEVDTFTQTALDRDLTDAEWGHVVRYLGPEGNDLRREVTGKIIEYQLVTSVRTVSATTAALDYNLAALVEVATDLLGAEPSDDDQQHLVDFMNTVVEKALTTPAEHEHTH